MATEVLIFPYLPLHERAMVGGWELLPPGSDTARFTSPDVQTLAEGLLSLYHDDRRPPMGALVAPPGGRIGNSIARNAMDHLRRSVLVGLLEGNPTPPALLHPDEDPDLNGGWRSVTSDNATLWGHPIDDSGYTAVEYGSMLTVLSGGHNVLRPDETKIHPPVEVPHASMYRGFDDAYASATFEVLDAGNETARRVGRAIDWLDLAWRNTPSITPEVRVVLLRTGFEVLFGSDDSYEVRDALSVLVDDADAPRTVRTWRTLAGREQSAELTDVAWWFQQFAFVRNAIMHGDIVPAPALEHEDRPHVWVGESRLRDAIKRTVAAEGHPHLLVDRATRERDARVQAMVARLDAALDDPPSPPGASDTSLGSP